LDITPVILNLLFLVVCNFKLKIAVKEREQGAGKNCARQSLELGQ